MNKSFYTALTYVDKIVYEPNQLIVKSIQEEKQNSNYAAGIFQLLSKTIRFRVAKRTPTNAGHFFPKDILKSSSLLI